MKAIKENTTLSDRIAEKIVHGLSDVIIKYQSALEEIGETPFTSQLVLERLSSTDTPREVLGRSLCVYGAICQLRAYLNVSHLEHTMNRKFSPGVRSFVQNFYKLGFIILEPIEAAIVENFGSKGLDFIERAELRAVAPDSALCLADWPGLFSKGKTFTQIVDIASDKQLTEEVIAYSKAAGKVTASQEGRYGFQAALEAAHLSSNGKLSRQAEEKMAKLQRGILKEAELENPTLRRGKVSVEGMEFVQGDYGLQAKITFRRGE